MSAKQKYNTSTMVEYRGESKTVKTWAATIDMNPQTLTTRLNNGMDIGDALSRPNYDPRGIRTRNIEELMVAINKVATEPSGEAGLSRLECEIREYAAQHGVLKLYKDFGQFFPKNTQPALDGSESSTRKIATVIMFGNAPTTGLQPNVQQITINEDH